MSHIAIRIGVLTFVMHGLAACDWSPTIEVAASPELSTPVGRGLEAHYVPRVLYYGRGEDEEWPQQLTENDWRVTAGPESLVTLTQASTIYPNFSLKAHALGEAHVRVEARESGAETSASFSILEPDGGEVLLTEARDKEFDRAFSSASSFPPMLVDSSFALGQRHTAGNAPVAGETVFNTTGSTIAAAIGEPTVTPSGVVHRILSTPLGPGVIQLSAAGLSASLEVVSLEQIDGLDICEPDACDVTEIVFDMQQQSALFGVWGKLGDRRVLGQGIEPEVTVVNGSDVVRVITVSPADWETYGSFIVRLNADKAGTAAVRVAYGQAERTLVVSVAAQ